MADILIKGIDMNTAREKRFLNVHVFIAEGDTMEASAIDIFGKVIGFYDVVEVKPHGRLIDADKLTDIIISCIRDSEKEYPKEDFGLVKMVYESCLYHIGKAPTVLEATE